MTDDQKAKKNANKRSTRTITFAFLVDCTEQREVKRQMAREKYASMLADKKTELNAKRRESYHQKKAEREAAQNNLGVFFKTFSRVSIW